jgi:hypothetical protein
LDKERNVKKQVRIITVAILGLVLPAVTGCNSKTMPLQKSFANIKLTQTSSTEVMDQLPEKGMLMTTNAVSVLNKKGWSREIGIVQFSEEDSTVLRKDYLQIRSQLAPILIFLDEKMLLQIQTIVPDEILNEPYENDMRKNDAILRFCHESLMEDGRAFSEDRQTESLIGLARTALGIGIQQFSVRPREAEQLFLPNGFTYDHPNLGKCKLNLLQQEENIYTVVVRGGGWSDPVSPW